MTSTPPPSSLSTPSPTERDPWNQSQSQAQEPPSESEIPSLATLQAMNTAKSSKPIYLIVATATNPPLGIGLKGQLPWGQIRTDMAFFRKATTGKSNAAGGSPTPRALSPDRKLNAVLMGRKTYESIPTRFRPLSDRVNVVLTRSDVRGFADRILHELTGAKEGREPAEYRLVDQATVDGLSHQVVSIVKRDHEQPLVVVTDSLEKAVGVDSRDVFCIGGAEIYRAVLEEQGMRSRLRVLQTEVRKLDGAAFECDTFWPEAMQDGENGWKKAESKAVEGWTGVELPQGSEEWKKDEKAEVEIRVLGWER